MVEWKEEGQLKEVGLVEEEFELEVDQVLVMVAV